MSNDQIVNRYLGDAARQAVEVGASTKGVLSYETAVIAAAELYDFWCDIGWAPENHKFFLLGRRALHRTLELTAPDADPEEQLSSMLTILSDIWEGFYTSRGLPVPTLYAI